MDMQSMTNSVLYDLKNKLMFPHLAEKRAKQEREAYERCGIVEQPFYYCDECGEKLWETRDPRKIARYYIAEWTGANARGWKKYAAEKDAIYKEWSRNMGNEYKIKKT